MPHDQAQDQTQGSAQAGERGGRTGGGHCASPSPVLLPGEASAPCEKSGIYTKRTERDGFSEACPLRERHARAPSPLREPEYGRAVPAGLRHLRREAFAQALIRSRCADLRHIPAEGRFFSDEAHERSQKKALETRYCDGTASRAGFSVFRCVCRMRRMSRMRLSCADAQSGGHNARPGSCSAVWNSAEEGEADRASIRNRLLPEGRRVRRR